MSLAPGAVWATLIPDPTEVGGARVNISVDATIAAVDAAAAIALDNQSLSDGQVAYILASRPSLEVEPQLQSLTAIAVSPDSQHVYGLNADQNALVVVNADTGSQRQLLVDGFDGVDGLEAATAIAVSPDGVSVYVTSVTESAIAFFDRDASTGNLSFVSTISTLTENETVFANLTLSADGTQLFTAGGGGHSSLWAQP